MVERLKLVLIGETADEVNQLMRAQAHAIGGARIKVGPVAGVNVMHFRGSCETGTGPKDFTLYALAGIPDYGDLYRVLLGNADGVVAVIAAASPETKGSLRLLGELQKAMLARREQGGELPFVLQYHYPNSQPGLTVEELDRALGVNPDAVARVATFADQSNQTSATLALLGKLVNKAQVEDLESEVVS